jgi:hypothetical protein
MSTVIYSLTHSPERARTMVSTLQAIGIPDNHLALLFPEHDEENAITGHLLAPARPLAALLSGGMLSGTLGWTVAGAVGGWFLGLAAMVATGIVYSHSILLVTAFSVSAVCALAGALLGLALTARAANRYGDRVRSDGVVIAVHDVQEDEVPRIDRILNDSGAESIAHAPEPEAAAI